MTYSADEFRDKIAALLDVARVPADLRIATPDELTVFRSLLAKEDGGDFDYGEVKFDYGVVLDECVAIVFSADTSEPTEEGIDWFFNFQREPDGEWSDGELYNNDSPFEFVNSAIVMALAHVVHQRLDRNTGT